MGDWPLQSAPLEIDQAVRDEGEPIAALTLVRSNHREEIGEHGWQLLEDVRVNPKRISLDLARGGWAVRVAPDLEHIEVDPDRLSGRPTIRGRRVPVSLVSGLADDEGGVEILHEDYDLNDYEIGDARCRIEVTRSFANAA